jgi:integrase
MSALALHLTDYLTARKNLGHRVTEPGRILRALVRFAEQRGQEIVTADLFLRWREEFGRAGDKTWSMRLGEVRRFALWLQFYDPRHEVPPAGLVSARYQRKRPYIYNDREVKDIITASESIPSKRGIVSITAPMLFGLIAVTGMRVSEALSLDLGDVDLARRVIHIRYGKGSKERLIVVDETTSKLLERYMQRRLRLCPDERAALFVADDGRRLPYDRASIIFAKACMAAGIREYPHRRDSVGRGPRIHDLRHTFAVNTMIRAYRAGQDPSKDVLRLSTFLGHYSSSATYWYVEAVPELLRYASQMLPYDDDDDGDDKDDEEGV